MASKPTNAQVAALERLASGDNFQPRYHFQFCFSEREKWVYLWNSDRTVASKSVTNALFDKGWYYGGGITPAGLDALALSRPTPGSKEK